VGSCHLKKILKRLNINNMKKYIFFTSYIVFLIIFLTFFYLLLIERNPSEIPSNLINKKIPEFKTKSLIKNREFNSKYEFEKEIILVNFFASWCKPCRDEHKYIMNFFKKENLKIVGINYKDNSNKAISWLNDLGNPYSDVLTDNNGRLAIDWGVYGIPETFIVSSEGLIKYRHVGPITEREYDKIKILINDLRIK